ERAEIRDVLGREEGGDPAVGDLAGQGGVPGPDGGQVDVDVVLHGLDRELECLAGAVRERELERRARMGQALAAERLANDGDVVPRAVELARETLTVPAF